MTTTKRAPAITLDDARARIRADYYQDVNAVAEDIITWWRDNPDADRESLIEYIDESVDGSGRVIYTQRATECLMVSGNDNAGPEEMGLDSFDFQSGIPWSQLAYFAFRADIIEELGRLDFDVNNPAHDDT